jgi:transposase
VTPATVCKWRGRFQQQRLDGVYDEPRPGAVRTITDEQVEAVIVRTLETTPRGATHWSTREMAKTMGMSRMAISRIWHAFGLQPHRSETFKLSNDPLLVEKVRDIVGLYLDPRRTRRCSASMRSRKCRRSIGRNHCCRCGRDKSNDGRSITNGTARPHCSRR